MKRNKKLLLLLGILVVLSLAAFGAVKLSSNTPEESSAETVTAFSADTESVTALKWTYLDNTLSFLYTDGQWIDEERTDFPLEQNSLDSILSTFCDITATRAIDTPEDLAEYGLDTPTYAVTVTTDGEYTLNFGNTTSTGDIYMEVGEGTVYLVDGSLVNSLVSSRYALVEKESIPSMTSVTSFSVETEQRTLEIAYLTDDHFCYNDAYVWFLREDDTYTVLDNELTEDFIYHITNLSWGDCVEVGADRDSLAEYGLTSPTVSVAVGYEKTTQQATNEVDEDGNTVYETVTTEEAFVLEIGDAAGSGYYARIKDSHMVYLIDESIVNAMRYTTREELLPDELILPEEEEILSVDVILEDETYTFTRNTRQVEVESEDSTAEPTYTEEIYWLLGENEVDFDSVLSDLSAISTTGSLNGQIEVETDEIAFVFHLNNSDYPEIALTFHQHNSTDCTVTLNGETRLLIPRSDVVDLKEAVLSLTLD